MNPAGRGRGLFYLHKRESWTQLVRAGAAFPGFRGCSERPVHVLDCFRLSGPSLLRLRFFVVSEFVLFIRLDFLALCQAVNRERPVRSRFTA